MFVPDAKAHSTNRNISLTLEPAGLLLTVVLMRTLNMMSTIKLGMPVRN